uniref:Nucleosome assembly protein 1-like 1 n=1 Tax=Macrostomum lignano TaxID=282301 RepID=A0A1I8GF06_9PLAT
RPEFFRELHQLEERFAGNYLAQLDRRREIVAGDVTIEEVDESGERKSSDVKGVPDFWLTAMKNVELLAEMVQPHDEPVLKQLRDIQVRLFSGEENGFELTFKFAPNDWFTNETLTKTYYLRMGPTRDQPWSYEGPEIIRCKGCDIYWRKGKNVTVKVVKKVQKHKSGGQKRTVTKTVETDSFFNFFSPPSQSVDELEDNDEDVENILQSDFEIGHFLRDRFVPRAVLYFTGDALEDDDEDEEDDEDDEEDDGEDGEGRGAGGANGPKQECKQQ